MINFTDYEISGTDLADLPDFQAYALLLASFLTEEPITLGQLYKKLPEGAIRRIWSHDALKYVGATESNEYLPKYSLVERVTPVLEKDVLWNGRIVSDKHAKSRTRGVLNSGIN